MSTTLYGILGVSHKANNSEIKKAYRQKMKKLHPDTSDNYEKKEFFKVRKAYEILSNDNKKLVYDKWLEKHSKFKEIYKNMWKTYEKNSRQNKKNKTGKKAQSFNMTIFLTPDEMKNGKKIPVYIKGQQIYVTIPKKTYPGKKISYLTSMENGKDIYINIKASLKKISGERIRENGDVYISTSMDTNTAALGGNHEIKTPLGETLTINLKNGVRNGQIIRLKNAGMYKKSGERGDLFVSISVKKVIFSLKAAFGM